MSRVGSRIPKSMLIVNVPITEARPIVLELVHDKCSITCKNIRKQMGVPEMLVF